MNPGAGKAAESATQPADRPLELLVSELECAEALKDLIRIMRNFESAQQNYMLAERTYQNVAARVSELSECHEIGPDILKRMVRLRIALNALAGVYAPGRQPGASRSSVGFSQPVSD
jgi:hypothetical protein